MKTLKSPLNLVYLLLASILIISFTAPQFGPGINNPVPIAKFLNANLPTTTPSTTGGTPVAPALLSQTGAFADLATLSPSAGVIPYDMIEPFWSDGAEKSRWMAIPNDGTHDTAAEQILFSADGNWTFPQGAVLIKHFELGGKRLETRFQVLGDDGVYYYLTYKWNAAQTDADLLLDGLDETVVVGQGTQVWHYPSRSECRSCHTNENGYVLGPKTRHLNKNITYPSTGINANQLVTLSSLGILTETITDANVGNYSAVAAKDDLSASLEDRARSYMDVNCSHCHHPTAINGGMFDMRFTTPLADQNLLYGPLLYDEGLVDPKAIIPQDVAHSMVHFRMNSLEIGIAMPPLAKNEIDAEGVQLIADWINSITPATSFPPVAVFSASTVFGTAPLLVNLDASASSDADGDLLSYTWAFGDGSTDSGKTSSYTYTTPGSYTITLVVDDGEFNDFTTETITVNVGNPGGNTVGFTEYTNLVGGPNYSGVAIAISDMNADGKDDIIRYNQGMDLNIHLQNAPNTAFTAYNFGAVNVTSEWSTCIADVDKNGYNDILVGGFEDGIKIIKNNNLTFTSSVLPASDEIFLQGSNFADINNDGWIDVFACHDNGLSRAYNNQNGSFTDDPTLINTATVPFSDNSGNYASMWTDYDNDGDLDLYISKCRQGITDSTDPRRINMLWQNDGSNNYTEVAAAANLKIGRQSWLSDFGDIDNDGDLDCIVINHYDDSNLMRNNGDGTFTDITAGSGLLPALDANVGLGIQANFRDFNNDGFIDLIYAGEKHLLFYNNGDGSFTEAPNPFVSNQIESFAIGDLNSDGFLDVYAGYANIFTNPSTTNDRLFFNDGNSNHYITILLEGVVSNINGIGARIEIFGPWGKQIREVRSGEGYGIHNSLSQHFGTGQAVGIDSIVVKWPSGIMQQLYDIDVDQFITIVEDINCALTGTPCNDNNSCTLNDMYNSACNCVGTSQEGNSCDDGNPCTIDDMLDANCVCIGASPAGTPCDDGDSCTINDILDANCGCAGTFQDSDNDGICDANESPCQLDACLDATLTIVLDQYTEETTWTVVNAGGLIEFSGGNYATSPDYSTVVETFCLKEGCYDFKIYDSFGDGICCEFGNGSYLLEADGITLAAGGEFLRLDSTNFCISDITGVGLACDDNDLCTINDTFDESCGCIGTFQDTDNDGICDADEIYINPIKAVLAGAYDATTGLMKDDLRAAGLLPLTEPYTSLGYNLVGKGGGSTSAAVFAVTGADAIIDWLLVELRDPTDNSVVIESKVALLQADGDIVQTDGITPLIFSSTTSNSYFVAIKHRNHLAAITATPYVINEGRPLDFTDSATTANGWTSLGEGDATGDGIVDAADRSTTWNERNTVGYFRSDVNLSAFTDAGDRSICWNRRNTGTEVVY